MGIRLRDVDTIVDGVILLFAVLFVVEGRSEVDWSVVSPCHGASDILFEFEPDNTMWAVVSARKVFTVAANSTVDMC